MNKLTIVIASLVLAACGGGDPQPDEHGCVAPFEWIQIGTQVHTDPKDPKFGTSEPIMACAYWADDKH